MTSSASLRLRGSSPLARGLLIRRELAVMPLRIIPARAGFTGEEKHVRVDIEDHPRSRGVYTCAIPDLAASEGSSPLARGLLTFLIDRLAERRIIPARAEFTNHAAGIDTCSSDHPRSRGVY